MPTSILKVPNTKFQMNSVILRINFIFDDEILGQRPVANFPNS